MLFEAGCIENFYCDFKDSMPILKLFLLDGWPIVGEVLSKPSFERWCERAYIEYLSDEGFQGSRNIVPRPNCIDKRIRNTILPSAIQMSLATLNQ